MIEINKRWAIRSGNNSVCLCKSFMVKGEKEWRDQFHFADIPGALNKLVDIAVLRGLDQGSWEAILDAVNETRAEIKAIKDILEGYT